MKNERLFERQRTFIYTGYNLTLHPHPSPKIYIDFFKFILEKKFFLPTGYRTYHLTLHDINFIDSNDQLAGFYGSIVRYENLLPSEFIDLNTGKTPEDLELNIASNIKYKPTFFHFIFYPKDHKLVFELENEKSTISINIILQFFKKILDSDKFKSKFTSGEIHPMKSRKEVNTILKNKKLKKIEFFISRPNPDIFDDLIDSDVTDYLEEKKAKEMTLTLTAQDGKFLNMGGNTEKLGLVAADNGEVYAAYEGPNHKTIEVSTKKFPLKLQEAFTKSTTIENRLRFASDKIVRKKSA